MNSKTDTGLVEHQGAQFTLPDSFWLRGASRARKLSTQFGWPMLLLILIAPPDVNTVSYSDRMYFYLSLGLPFIAIGTLVRIWARGYLRSEGFVLDGPYRYVRNPVEVGAVLCYFGSLIIMGITPWYIVGAICTAVAYLALLGTLRDAELYSNLGGLYLRYKMRVRRWIPSRLPGMNRSNRSFSVVKSLHHERESLIWLCGFALVFAIRRHTGY